MYTLTDYGSMLRDRVRIDAYRRALTATITPSSIVLDLGTGLGTFGILASQLGAARVYAVEPADVIATAKEIARANGVSNIEFIQARVEDVQLPERVDVVVSDLGGALPLFEEHIPALVHAREQLLKANGVLVPRGSRLFCAPIASEELYARIVEPWRSVEGVDFSIAETMALNTPHALKVEPQHLAAEPRCWAELDYATIISPNVSGTAQWDFATPQIVHGVALWFESELSDDVVYASGPSAQGSVHATMVLPLRAPRELQTLRFTIEATLVGGRYITTWQANDEPRQSTLYAEPRIPREETRNTGMKITADSIVVVAPGQLSAKVGEEAVIAGLSRGNYYALNPVAARVWELIRTPARTSDLHRTLTAEFDVTPEQCGADLLALLEQLHDEGLIEVTDAP